MLGKKSQDSEAIVKPQQTTISSLKDDINSTSLANVMLIGGAVLISVYPTMALSAKVFAAFMGGHVLWAIRAFRDMNRSLIALNAGYILLDAYAIYIRL